jgi:hypothetical protein
MSPITRDNFRVLTIGFAAALLLMAFANAAAVPALVVAIGVSLVLWLVRVAFRPDMPFSVAGIVIGVLVALLVPGLRSIVGPDAGLLGAWLLMALAA